MSVQEEKNHSQTPISSSSKKPENFWLEFFKLVLFAAVIVVPFRLFIAQPFIVDGLSMYPTFDNGDYLVIDELSYRFKTPERGSVLVFKYPNNPSKYFIKRVIGLPGETVSLNGGIVTITSPDRPEGLVLNEPYIELSKEETSTYTLTSDEYFVMGDNRAQSADSRLWGPVPKKNIVGRPFIQFLPPDLFPGDESNF